MASDTLEGVDGAPRVLVVDDERVLAGVVVNYLDRDGFDARACADGAEAVAVARTWDPAVIVLDLGLPGLDGLEVCRQVRRFSSCYVLMLTARDSEEDTLAGLAAGADDYVTKPFRARELVARVHALLRRPRTGAAPAASGRLAVGGLVLDPQGRTVTLDGEPVDLTRTEFDLLAALLARPGRAHTRRELLDEVWGPGWVGDDHVVDVHLGAVRRKLGDDPQQPRFISTVRGVGYRVGAGS